MNHLREEKSPYLIQHSQNPVDWYPWSEAAFDKAIKENKPVFLSIGYSTCHWCHVMEEQSFKDDEIGRLMNDTFVSIKVDREERPDIDQIFMNVCVMLNGNGGWPLSIIMTPDKKPFFAATYIPRSGRQGKMGMLELIPFIKNIWNSRQEEYRDFAEKIISEINNSEKISGGIDFEFFIENIFSINCDSFESSYDENYGGFGFKPKFPSAHNLMFLLNQKYRNGRNNYSQMVFQTLRNMRYGGIYDHVGFGFHRYSTDEQWKLPHFEKMLYDQALNTLVYIDAYLITHDPFYKKTAEEIIEYVQRDMTGSDGEFFSAEDADSEGIEGRYYLWTRQEILNALDKKEQNLFFKFYDIQITGNFEDESSGSPSGLNILYLDPGHDDIIDADETKKLIKIHKKLFNIREKRIRPMKDDKVLTNWNGLMIAAFAKASLAFQNQKYYDTALNCALFISKHLMNDEISLHRYRDKESSIEANLEDYAFYIYGLIHLYMAASDIRWLKTAMKIADIMVKNFYDIDNGGFFFSTKKSFINDKLFMRSKDFHDGALPSGNSVALYDIIMLDRLSGVPLWTKEIESTIKTFSEEMVRFPTGFSFFLIALDMYANPGMEIIINGNRDDREIKNVMKTIGSAFIPGLVIHQRNSKNYLELAQIAPFTSSMGDPAKTQFYICENFSCQKPISKSSEILKYLKDKQIIHN